MTTQRHQKDWEELGDLDPMWAVASRPGMENNRWDPEEFYGTGRRIVEVQRRNLREAGCPDHYDRVLDFGCGLGRLSYAWAPHAGEVVGVDIARPMVEKATAAARATNCLFQHNPNADLRLFPDASFDLVVSEVVLQHIPDCARHPALHRGIRACHPPRRRHLLPASEPPSPLAPLQIPPTALPRALGPGRPARLPLSSPPREPHEDERRAQRRNLSALARHTDPRALLHPEAVATTYIHQRR